MARVLDLSGAESSIMDLTLNDKDRTIVHLSCPTEALVRELEGMGPELHKLETGDRSAVDMIYDLAARLINCNLDFITVTGQELREKYSMDLFSALRFFNAYFDCINELTNQKN